MDLIRIVLNPMEDIFKELNEAGVLVGSPVEEPKK